MVYGLTRTSVVTYLFLMFAIVLIGISTTAAAKQWKAMVQREFEADLLSKGIEIQNALALYSATLKAGRVTPAELYPQSLAELTRLPKPFLRKAYSRPHDSWRMGISSVLRLVESWEFEARAVEHPSRSTTFHKRSDILKDERPITTGSFSIPIPQLPYRSLLEPFQPSQWPPQILPQILQQIFLQQELHHQLCPLLRPEDR